MKITQYVEYLCPGAFMPEEFNRQIETRDLEELKIPLDVYAFTFYDIKTFKATDEEGEEHNISTTVNKSPRHLIGEVYTYDQIVAMGERILASNVSQYETKSGVKTHLGNWQPLLEDDVVHSTDEITFTKPLYYKNISSTSTKIGEANG